MDFKVGKLYTVARRTGETVRGRLLGVEQKATGPFYKMDIGSRKEPKEINVRAAQLSK